MRSRKEKTDRVIYEMYIFCYADKLEASVFPIEQEIILFEICERLLMNSSMSR